MQSFLTINFQVAYAKRSAKWALGYHNAVHGNYVEEYQSNKIQNWWFCKNYLIEKNQMTLLLASKIGPQVCTFW